MADSLPALSERHSRDEATVENTMGAVAALLHVSVGNCDCGPDDFRHARQLGLIAAVNPVPTPLGRGVLRLLGHDA